MDEINARANTKSGHKGPEESLRGLIRGDARSYYKWLPGVPVESACNSLEKSLECDPE